MAQFAPAFERTLGHEGGYSNQPADRGGETYRGVARAHFPDWPGWQAIDRARGGPAFPRSLGRDAALQRAVEDLYRRHFWDRLQGDAIPDQAVAEELFDTAVNMGVRRSVRFLQEALNLLNRNQRSYRDLVVDGEPGPKTLATLAALLRTDGGRDRLLALLNVLQGCHYVALMRADPAQEAFAGGWLRRV
jgi:lysozyme family protein